ncbi:MAG: hypothetical protein NTV44_00795 [Firmicutes bacterium]|nr:hypothetical protein [Bacillota bacterium]
MKSKNLNLLIAISILVLTGCSSAKDSLKTIVENTTPISLNVHEKENSEILIDISETHQYSLKTIDSVTELKVYASEVLLFFKEYPGVINQVDNAQSVFELDGYFYFVVNFNSESSYLCNLYRVSLLGNQETVLSEHFDYGMNTNFYLDAYDSSFYLTFQESSESQYSLSKYLYDSGGVSDTPASTEYFDNLYLGIRNIIHKVNGDIYLCTNNEYVYKNGESQDLFSSSQIFHLIIPII